MNKILYTKSQRRGILVLCLIIVILQLVIFYDSHRDISFHHFDDIEVQKKIDSLVQIRQDAIKQSKKIKSFNPNYISDYKGYLLGLSKKEIDRLHEYRAQNKFVNSAKAFQKITKISDTLLNRISPYFKFPLWAKKNKKTNTPTLNKKNLNTASEKDFMAIYGIGKKRAQRIVKYRKLLGGFSLKSQLYEIYGLNNHIITQLWEQFEIPYPPKIKKLNINTVSAKKLAKIAYINYKTALEIIGYRTEKGYINNIDELHQIKDIDSISVSRLKLYLYKK